MEYLNIYIYIYICIYTSHTSTEVHMCINKFYIHIYISFVLLLDCYWPLVCCEYLLVNSEMANPAWPTAWTGPRWCEAHLGHLVWPAWWNALHHVQFLRELLQDGWFGLQELCIYMCIHIIYMRVYLPHICVIYPYIYM